MENNKAFKYNVEAYISTILNNNKDKIGDINDFIIEIKYKSGSVGSFPIEKDKLIGKIDEILCDNGVTLISEVNIGYLKDGIINNLNGINVF